MDSSIVLDSYEWRLPVSLRSLEVIDDQSTKVSFANRTLSTIVWSVPRAPLPVFSLGLSKLKIKGDYSFWPELPATLISLTICTISDLKINVSVPLGLSELTLEGQFNDELKDYLPQNLLFLELGNNFRQPLASLPNNLTTLHLGASFSGEVKNLPLSLLHLKIAKTEGLAQSEEKHLRDSFNSPVISWPPLLKTLVLGDAFNQPLNKLPSSLAKVEIGGAFSQTLDDIPPHVNYLSAGIPISKSSVPWDLSYFTSLIFGNVSDFAQNFGIYLILLGATYSLSWALPITSGIPVISFLTGRAALLGGFFSGLLQRNILFSAWGRIFGEVNKTYQRGYSYLGRTLQLQIPLDFYPKDVKKLRIGCFLDHPISTLPLGLTDLELKGISNKNFYGFPKTLLSFTLDQYVIQPLNQLPRSLQVLQFNEGFNKSLEDLPPSLFKLQLGNDFRQSLQGLPKTLTYLDVGNSYFAPLPVLPPFLKTLILGDSFNSSVDRLPSSLTSLQLGNTFSQPISTLPVSLLQLTLPRTSNQGINLPPYLQELTCSLRSPLTLPPTLQQLRLLNDVLATDEENIIQKMITDSIYGRQKYSLIQYDSEVKTFDDLLMVDSAITLDFVSDHPMQVPKEKQQFLLFANQICFFLVDECQERTESSSAYLSGFFGEENQEIFSRIIAKDQEFVYFLYDAFSRETYDNGEGKNLLFLSSFILSGEESRQVEDYYCRNRGKKVKKILERSYYFRLTDSDPASSLEQLMMKIAQTFIPANETRTAEATSRIS